MEILFIICAIILLFFLFYAIIPTVFIRLDGWRVTKELKEADGIVLTFDDGPNPEYTVQLLELLKKYHVKATFFVVGSKVKKNRAIIRQMYYDGHTVGIHHYDHLSSWFISPFKLKRQLSETAQVIKECTNKPVLYYRPPWGHFNIFTLFLSRKYHIIMWSNIFGDWKIKNCQDSLLSQLRMTVEKGSIVLLHDCGETKGADQEAPKYMLRALEIYLQESKNKGRHFITLEEGLNQMKRSI